MLSLALATCVYTHDVGLGPWLLISHNFGALTLQNGETQSFQGALG